MTVQCCVCKMVRDGEAWKFEGHGSLAAASHTYCPRCLKVSVAAMRAERARAKHAHPVGA